MGCLLTGCPRTLLRGLGFSRRSALKKPIPTEVGTGSRHDTSYRARSRVCEVSTLDAFVFLRLSVLLAFTSFSNHEGTDAGDTHIFPGFGVHDELEQLVDAGIEPAAALRMATLEPARFLAKEQSFGSIEPGKVADIVLLRSNPLLDIGATRDIEALLFNGGFYDRVALDQLLQFAEHRSASWQLNLQLLWSALRSPLVMQQVAD